MWLLLPRPRVINWSENAYSWDKFPRIGIPTDPNLTKLDSIQKSPILPISSDLPHITTWSPSLNSLSWDKLFTPKISTVSQYGFLTGQPSFPRQTMIFACWKLKKPHTGGIKKRGLWVVESLSLLVRTFGSWASTLWTQTMPHLTLQLGLCHSATHGRCSASERIKEERGCNSTAQYRQCSSWDMMGKMGTKIMRYDRQDGN